MKIPRPVMAIIREMTRAGGRALIVGGAVRDSLLSQATKDFDIVVYGVSPEIIKRAAHRIGRMLDIGRSFGNLRIISGRLTIDITLPRRESKVAPGHRGFAIELDPKLSIEEDLRRRDFTINAIAYDPVRKKYIDPFGGKKDIRRKILRVVSPATFADDPLRVLRAIQFVGRFGLQADQKTVSLLKKTASALSEISRDRAWAEWNKLVIHGKYRNRALALATTIAVVPIDASISPRANAVLNSGKISPSVFWAIVGFFQHQRDWGHALRQIGAPRGVRIDAQTLLTATHDASPQATIVELRRTARRLQPLRLIDWQTVVRTTRPDVYRRIRSLAVRHPSILKKPKSVLTGADILTHGYGQGPAIGALISAANDAYDSGLSRSQIQKILRTSTSAAEAAAIIKSATTRHQ